MLHGSPSPGVAGSELTRLLALLTQAPPLAERPAFAERLGHWLGWKGDIALSAALNAAPAVPGPRPAAVAPDDEEADFHRVAAALAASLAAGPEEPGSSPNDFGPRRRHCLAQQQAMHDAICALRRRLRASLSRRSADGARLAAIDEVMDESLALHERGLLGLVPLRLQAHFERLQQASSVPLADDPDTDTDPDAAPWARAFDDDMERVLRAELAHRLLPAQGLLDALRTLETT